MGQTQDEIIERTKKEIAQIDAKRADLAKTLEQLEAGTNLEEDFKVWLKENWMIEVKDLEDNMLKRSFQVWLGAYAKYATGKE